MAKAEASIVTELKNANIMDKPYIAMYKCPAKMTEQVRNHMINKPTSGSTRLLSFKEARDVFQYRFNADGVVNVKFPFVDDSSVFLLLEGTKRNVENKVKDDFQLASVENMKVTPHKLKVKYRNRLEVVDVPAGQAFPQFMTVEGFKIGPVLVATYRGGFFKLVEDIFEYIEE